jgi:photosystem II stability/assembly factor-like uncharacterized protein
MRRFLALLGFALIVPVPPAPLAAQIDPGMLAGLKARSIGPAAMSGRVTAVTGVESNPDVLYAGGASGGVWKSVNGGLTWTPVFDDQPVASIGDIAVFPANPDVVWVGTGEANIRNSVSIGNGIYRSLDGGHTWKHLGLEASEHISRIALDPTDPNVAYVAALGRAWGENAERGVFKTTDGGKTWRKVLYVDEKTGAADLKMDPQNPNKLFAALWQFRRWPWSFRSGGPGSGLYVSYDGGESWKRYTEDDGLPKGELGRIGVDVSRSDPRIVYALVEAEKNVLLRSEDGGRTWRSVNEDPQTGSRPFYYAYVKVDPALPNRVYDLTARLTVSNDGGRTFQRLGRSNDIHGDFHTLWIDSRHPDHLVTGEDGGLAISRDRGETWLFAPNLPLGQFYHVGVDMDVPYHVYGGLQDNASWRGPSSVWEQGGVRNQHWDRVGFGDGFDTQPDPTDSMLGYSMSQGGALVRWNLHSGEMRSIRPPQVHPGERLRFNWNAGLALDPFAPGTLYYGSQYLHESTDRGETWTAISPDLTSNNPEWQRQAASGGLTLDVSAAENFTTIVAIAPSTVQRGVLWVGTDDGRLHVTRDGGKTWESVEKNVPGVPANTWIPHIRPSKFDAGSAFVVFDDHRRSNFAPYVYRTDDWGKTWKSLAGKDLRGYALAIEQDPVDRDLLFLGTEFGLWTSFDGGAHWLPWKPGLPTVSVMDLAIHPRDHDLVIGTHGRALYVLDDVTPLRTVSADVLRQPIHLFPAGDAILHTNRMQGGAYRAAAGDFEGDNRPYGALLTYSLNVAGLPYPDADKERERKEKLQAKAAATPARPEPVQATAAKKEDVPRQEEVQPEEPAEAAPGERGEGGARAERGPQVDIRITDAKGKVLRSFKGPAKLGINRATWDLGRDAFRRAPREDRGEGGRFQFDSGPKVPPGTYGVTVRYGKQEAKGEVRVVADPYTHDTPADWQAREAAIERAGAIQNTLVEAVERIGAARGDVDLVVRKLEQEGREARRQGGEGTPAPHRELLQAARKLRQKLTDAERRLHVPPGTKGLVDDQTPLGRTGDIVQSFGASWQPPSASQKSYLDLAESSAREALAAVNRLFAEDVPAFRKQVADAKIDLLPAQPPLAIGEGKP